MRNQPRSARLYAKSVLACAVLLQWFCAVPASASESALKQLIEHAKDSDSAVVLVMRNQKLLAEYHDQGAPTRKVDLRSATSSVVALASGLLLRDGRVESLDMPVCRFYPEWNQGRKRLITIRMLLSQTAGLQESDEEGASSPDVVRLALAAELQSNPGEKFSASAHAVNLLMGIIGKATGIAADEYIARELFAPLGIHEVSWQRDRAGNPLGMTGLAMNAEDAAKLGQLVLDAGRWNDRQIVPASFIEEMLNSQSSKSAEYGLLWARAPAWIRLSVDETSLDLIRSLSVHDSIVAQVSTMTGRSFTSSEALVAALHKVLSDAQFDALYESAQAQSVRMGTIFHLELGPVAAFSANGEGGEFIVVVPAARLIAVRVADSQDGHGEYDDFVGQVLDVAQSWNSSLKPHPSQPLSDGQPITSRNSSSSPKRVSTITLKTDRKNSRIHAPARETR
jgi:CubicO group peptidase (beta-lactamase class C family)